MKRLFAVLAVFFLTTIAQAQTAPPKIGPDYANVTWYMADGSSGQCVPITGDLVGSMENYWKARDSQVAENVLDPGYYAITIFQGGNKQVTIYENQDLCAQWLPIAIRMVAEQRAENN
jgi:hypothetical protein